MCGKLDRKKTSTPPHPAVPTLVAHFPFSKKQQPITSQKSATCFQPPWGGVGHKWLKINGFLAKNPKKIIICPKNVCQPHCGDQGGGNLSSKQKTPPKTWCQITWKGPNNFCTPHGPPILHPHHQGIPLGAGLGDPRQAPGKHTQNAACWCVVYERGIVEKEHFLI